MLSRAQEFAIVIRWCEQNGYHRVAKALKMLDGHERRHQGKRKQDYQTQKHIGYEPLEPLKPLRELKRGEPFDRPSIPGIDPD